MFQRVLFLASPGDDAALERVLAIVDATGAELTLAALVAAVPRRRAVMANVAPGALQDLVDRQAERQLKDLWARVAPNRAEPRIHALAGVRHREVIVEVLAHDHDLVILDGTSSAAAATGRQLLRKCPAAVWIIRDPRRPVRRVVAAVDTDPADGDDAHQALDATVLDLASVVNDWFGAELHVGHAWYAPEEAALRSSAFASLPADEVDVYVEEIRLGHEQAFHDLLRRLPDEIQPVTHLRRGHAGDAIPDLVADAGIDLIVMGTVGRTGIPGLITGNTSEQILGSVGCSILAVKPNGFRTPFEVD